MHSDPWFGPPVLYRPGALDTDVQRIVTFYATKGYFGARVTRREVKRREDNEYVDIELTIDEGKATTVREVTIEGLSGVGQAAQKAAYKALKLVRGKRFDYGAYKASKAGVARALKERGYAYADAKGSVEVHRSDHWARVVITADPGPLVRFGGVRVKGNGPLPADKLVRRLTIVSGKRYDERVIDRSRDRISQLRMFSSIRLSLPKEPTEVAPLTLAVRPGKLREIRLGFGVGIERQRHELRARFEWTLLNFLGGLRRLRIRLKPAFVVLPAVWDAQRLGPTITTDARLDQPDWLNTGLDAFVEAGYDIETQLGFRFHGPRGTTGVAYSFFDQLLRIELSFNIRFYDFFDVNDAAFDAQATALGLGFVDPYRLIYLSPALIFDWRDDARDPRLGLYFEARLEHGAIFYGGDFDYVKGTLDGRAYLPLGTKRIVLAVRAMFGDIQAFRGSDSPITQRYRLGGPVSHRGFTTGQLSPQVVNKNNGDRVPLGGNATLMFSADLRLRLFKLGSAWLSLSAFADYGDAVSALEEIDLGAMHLAVGGTLQYATPIGLLRIGVGVRLNRTEETTPPERDNPDPGQNWALMITIGEAF